MQSKGIALQSQRDCGLEPRVGTPTLGARDPVRAQPQRGCGQSKLIREQPKLIACFSEATGCRNPVGVAKPSGSACHEAPQGNRVRQPWAMDATPLGVATTIGRCGVFDISTGHRSPRYTTPNETFCLLLPLLSPRAKVGSRKQRV